MYPISQPNLMRKCSIFQHPCLLSTVTTSHVVTIRSVSQWSGIIVSVTTMFSSTFIALVRLSSLSSTKSSCSSCQVLLFCIYNITNSSRLESLPNTAKLGHLYQELEPWEHARGGRPREMPLHRRKVSLPDFTRSNPEKNSWTSSPNKVGNLYK